MFCVLCCTTFENYTQRHCTCVLHAWEKREHMAIFCETSPNSMIKGRAILARNRYLSSPRRLAMCTRHARLSAPSSCHIRRLLPDAALKTVRGSSSTTAIWFTLQTNIKTCKRYDCAIDCRYSSTYMQIHVMCTLHVTYHERGTNLSFHRLSRLVLAPLFGRTPRKGFVR